MMRFLPLLDSTLMFGVGAAFDFHTGRIKDCPQWVKRAGHAMDAPAHAGPQAFVLALLAQ